MREAKLNKLKTMASKVIQRLVEMVEKGDISKDHPLFEGRYEEIKREVEKGQDNG